MDEADTGEGRSRRAHPCRRAHARGRPRAHHRRHVRTVDDHGNGIAPVPEGRVRRCRRCERHDDAADAHDRCTAPGIRAATDTRSSASAAVAGASARTSSTESAGWTGTARRRWTSASPRRPGFRTDTSGAAGPTTRSTPTGSGTASAAYPRNAGARQRERCAPPPRGGGPAAAGSTAPAGSGTVAPAGSCTAGPDPARTAADRGDAAAAASTARIGTSAAAAHGRASSGSDDQHRQKPSDGRRTSRPWAGGCSSTSGSSTSGSSTGGS